MDADQTKTEISQNVTGVDEDKTSRRRSGFCCGCVVGTVILSIIFVVVLIMLFSSPEEIVARAKRSLGGADTVQTATTQLTEAQMRAVRGPT